MKPICRQGAVFGDPVPIPIRTPARVWEVALRVFGAAGPQPILREHVHLSPVSATKFSVVGLRIDSCRACRIARSGLTRAGRGDPDSVDVRPGGGAMPNMMVPPVKGFIAVLRGMGVWPDLAAVIAKKWPEDPEARRPDPPVRIRHGF